MNNDNFNLSRFIEAQEHDYPTSLQEIKNGAKVTHWIWYIFPQLKGLGYSWNSNYYGLNGVEEAKRIAESIDVLFLTHPHDDHYSPVMLQAVVDAGKTVVLPCMLPDWENSQASILDSELIRPKEMGDFSISSLGGNQGEDIPNNVYLIEFNGWRILHQGDNAVWDLQEKLKDMPMADIIIAPSWNGIQWLLKPAMQAKKLRGREPLLLPVHNNEMCHSVDHRESYHELFNRQDRLGDPNFKYPRFVLIDNGDHVSLQH